MLTGLKVLSLACECAFYWSEHNANGGSHELNFDGLNALMRNVPKRSDTL